MREIFFLLLLSVAFNQFSASDSSPMKSILINDDEGQHGIMTFLVRKKCGDQASSDGLTENLYLDGRGDRSPIECSDTIGFLPYTKKKVQVFVTVNPKKKVKVSGVEIEKKIKKIALWYSIAGTDTKLLTCDPEEGVVTIDSSFSNNPSPLFKIEKPEVGERLLTKSDSIVQCESFFLKGEESKLSDFNKNKWTLALEYEGETEDKYSGIIQDSNNQDLFNKIRCDPDEFIVIKPNEEDDKEYKEIEKKPLADEKIKKFVGNDATEKSFFEYTITNGECEQEKGYRMIYKKGNDIKEASRIDCEKTSGSGPPYIWKYVVTSSGNPKTFVNPGEQFNVECMRMKCKKCNDYKPTSSCVEEVGCTPVGTVTFNDGYKECRELNLAVNECEAKILLINDSKFKQPNPFPDKITCNNDGKYLLDGEEIKSLACAKKIYFSAGSEMKKHTTIANVSGLSASEPEEPACCDANTNSFICKLPKQLAIGNKDSTNWIRVETLVFNNVTGIFTYDRKHKDGVIKKHQLGANAIGCVVRPIDPRAEEKKAALRKKYEGSKSIVIAVNIVLLAVLIGVSIPAVIFYVNARIKKREAKKAAKKDKKKDEQSGDKKKEEQSGEKKDGETKKDEEKKNEA